MSLLPAPTALHVFSVATAATALSPPPALKVDRWSDSAVTFTVPSSVSPGTPASVTVVTGSGSMSDSPAFEITPSANPSDYYDSTGTSPDSDQGCANYDGVGYSYSANALASAGFTPGATVDADGLTFTWTGGQPCSPDSILAAGQTMLVSGPAGANTLGLLESSTDGGTQGTVTINYIDGTSSTQAITSSDWAGGPGATETAAATLPYRNSIGGSSQQLTVYVYATTVPVDPSKTVATARYGMSRGPARVRPSVCSSGYRPNMEAIRTR